MQRILSSSQSSLFASLRASPTTGPQRCATPPPVATTGVARTTCPRSSHHVALWQVLQRVRTTTTHGSLHRPPPPPNHHHLTGDVHRAARDGAPSPPLFERHLTHAS
jgi:hypothetical protein